MEKVESKKYADLPCLYKIKNNRRAKYAMELINVLAEKYQLVFNETKSDNYVLPYETTEELIKKGLIKELVSKNKYLDWLAKQNLRKGLGKKRTFITANEVDELLKDDVAISLVEKVTGTKCQTKE